MRIYEELFILDPKAPDEQVDAVVAQIEEVVKAADGSIDKVDRWGVRRLGYRIQKRDEGLFILVQFSSGAKAVHEIERRLRVDENVLKYITVRIDEKMKWLEKRKKIRDKRAARKPRPSHSRGSSEPAAARPGAPAPGAPKAPGAAPAAVAAPGADSAPPAAKDPAAKVAPSPAATPEAAPKTEGGTE